MKIGVLAGLEDTFPRAVVERLADSGVRGLDVEMVSTGAIAGEAAASYDVIFDRMSQRVRFYRGLVVHAANRGARVVNDPTVADPTDRFRQLLTAAGLGMATPRTLLLPQKASPGDLGQAALGNLVYPLPWERYLEEVGLPAFLRPAWAGGPARSQRIDSLEELFFHYDQSGEMPMLLQEFVEYDRFVRALVIGGNRVILARYEPEHGRYHLDPDLLDAALEERIVGEAAGLCRALGLDIDTVDFGIRDGVPVLLDAANPVPDLEAGTLSPFYFEKVVEAVADLLVQRGRERPRKPRSGSRPASSRLSLVISRGGGGRPAAAATRKKAKTTRKKAATTRKKAATTRKKAKTTRKKAATTRKKAATTRKKAATTRKKAKTTRKKAKTTRKKAKTTRKKAKTTRKKAKTTRKKAKTTRKKAKTTRKKAKTTRKKAKTTRKKAKTTRKKAKTTRKKAKTTRKKAKTTRKKAKTTRKKAKTTRKKAKTTRKKAKTTRKKAKTTRKKAKTTRKKAATTRRKRAVRRGKPAASRRRVVRRQPKARRGRA